jgi:ATP-dependent exoDNAse (exonuclease V) beta subunit
MSFTVYKSSAGSGKTYTLVKIYLSLIIKQPEQYRHILAITFTNKAANEMKERVLDQLQFISAWRPGSSNQANSLMAQLSAELKMGLPLIQKNAEKALELILHEYGNFNLSTIDSFMHRVVRSFAHDLQLSVNFEVDLDTDQLLNKAVDLLLSTTGSDADLTDLLMGFIEQKTIEEKSWQIEQDLFVISRSLMNENDQKYVEQLKLLTKKDFIKIIAKINAFQVNIKNQVKQIASKAIAAIDDKKIPHKAFYQGSRGLPGYFSNLANGKLDKLPPNNLCETAYKEDKRSSGSSTTREKASIDEIWYLIISQYEQLQKIYLEDYKHFVLYGLLLKTIHQVAVIHEIDVALRSILQKENIVPLAEFNKRIAEVVLKEPTPFVYERLGERFHHYLIDEFQDTSVMQWQNILPLVDNSLGSGYFNLVVGDGKQSIYRWRGGDVMQFIQLPAVSNPENSPIIAQREQSLKRNYISENLNRNYRSFIEIVNFNNELFEWIANQMPDEVKGVYEGVRQEGDQNKTGGGVQFSFYDKKGSELTEDELNLNKIIEIINDLAAHNYHYRDIALLFRSNKSASIIANQLLVNKIPVISSESLLLSSSERICFIVNFIRWIQNPDDLVLSTSLVINLLKQQGAEGMASIPIVLSKLSGGSIHSGHTLKNVLNLFDELGFSIKLSLFNKLHLIDLTEEIIRTFKLNEQNDPFLHFFMDAILKFSNTKKENSLVDFSDWWEDKKDSLSLIVSEGIDAIRIMTIHKSKGLQFPVVIFPYANQKIRLMKEVQWISLNDSYLPELPVALVPLNESLNSTDFGFVYEREMNQKILDLVNTLYVVMTRAEERLYVISERDDKTLNELKITSVHGLFTRFLVGRSMWNEEETEYLFGSVLKDRTIKVRKENLQKESVSLISNEWHNRILLSRRAPEKWETNDPDGHQVYGQMMHRLLSFIKTEQDIDGAIERLLSEGSCKETDVDHLKRLTMKLVEHPIANHFFKKDAIIKNEADILLPDGKSYRPDRVIISEGHATLIDFKTGKVSEHYRHQLLNYASILERMGYTQIQSFIIYINDELVIDVVL